MRSVTKTSKCKARIQERYFCVKYYLGRPRHYAVVAGAEHWNRQSSVA